MIAAFLVGCGPRVDTTPKISDIQPDVFECRIDGEACNCVIPEFSSKAIEDMGNRCNFLRGVASNLY